ncbi:MAG: penicillin-binding protein 2, partial [Candidatus Spechtbacterales bacterium]
MATWRTKLLFIFCALLAGALLFRLHGLQVERGDYYSAIALGQQRGMQEVLPPRGNIYFQDKAGTSRFLVATNREMPMVYAAPKEVEDPALTLSPLVDILQIEEHIQPVLIQRLSNSGSSYALIKNQISEEQAEKIRALGLEGIYVRNELVRFYPAQELASQLIGFVGYSGDKRMGQYGIERSFEDQLSGMASSSALFGNDGALEAGADVELTIDYGVQFFVEQRLKQAVEFLDADAGSAIFMDPKTGAIIAMANFPGFNPNTYGGVADIGIFTNDAVTGMFEPGSTFKPLTMASAIDAGAVSPSTTYNDTGSFEVDGYTIKNFDGRGRGIQTMTQVLESSLNTGVMYAQRLLGNDKFRDYISAFRIDKITGIELPGEQPGNVRNIEKRNAAVNFATATFGQGISMTPLQLLTAISALSNNGVMMRPYVVSKVSGPGGEEITQPKEIGTPVSPATAARLTSMLVSAAENGYDKKASIPGYSTAAKTGTAQVSNPNGPGYSDEVIHSFVGYAPAYNPRFVGIIKVDNPKTIRFAADSLAPVFKDISA